MLKCNFRLRNNRSVFNDSKTTELARPEKFFFLGEGRRMSFLESAEIKKRVKVRKICQGAIAS